MNGNNIRDGPAGTIRMAEIEFVGFPKMARLSRECIVTEKIDGTNAQIYITEYGDVFAGSRTRWITPTDDNFGFARWVAGWRGELLRLGPGRHFGEWWGSGIQRGYGMKIKRFSLFNVIRWCEFDKTPQRIQTADPRIEKFQDVLPDCVSLVPILWRGEFSTAECNLALEILEAHGSVASPGYRNPEGIVCFHVAGNVCFKKTIKNDDEPKSVVKK